MKGALTLIYLSNVPINNTPIARNVEYSIMKNLILSTSGEHVVLEQTMRRTDDNPSKRSTNAWFRRRMLGTLFLTLRLIRVYMYTTRPFRRVIATIDNVNNVVKMYTDGFDQMKLGGPGGGP